MTIYISIPISGKDINIQSSLANAIAKKIESKGHIPLNPFSVPEPPSHITTEKEAYAYYMGEDMKMLLACDAILMVDRDWRKSRGCSIEHSAANVMGMGIFYSIYDVPNEDRGNEDRGKENN